MGDTGFKNWYSKNKEELAEKRAKQYREDPAYREKVLQRSREYRANNRTETTPEGYEQHMAGAAEVIGVTVWTLREWRKKNYFPEPFEFKGKLWFTGNQLHLLTSLRQFFDEHGVRTAAHNRGALDLLTQVIYANWK